MRRTAIALAALTLAACGARPAELLPPAGKADYVDASVEHPRLKFSDGSVSENEACPVTKRKLSVWFPPVYVNGKPFGFC